jgi:hypothetical protein
MGHDVDYLTGPEQYPQSGQQQYGQYYEQNQAYDQALGVVDGYPQQTVTTALFPGESNPPANAINSSPVNIPPGSNPLLFCLVFFPN